MTSDEDGVVEGRKRQCETEDTSVAIDADTGSGQPASASTAADVSSILHPLPPVFASSLLISVLDIDLRRRTLPQARHGRRDWRC